jgi:hypothetical protein
VLGIGYCGGRRPPRVDFENRILQAFTAGTIHRPDTTFGNVNADALARFDPTFERTDFVDMIASRLWPR